MQTEATGRRQKRFWFGLIAIFLLALSMRLTRPASKYTVWYERSAQLWDALFQGRLGRYVPASSPH